MRRWIGPILAGLVLAALAWQAALIAAPRLLMTAALNRLEKIGGTNRLFFGPLPTAEARTIVRPSPDLAYASCPYDLSKAPLLIEVAPAPAPYWSLSVFDSRTDVAFVRNNRDSGGRPIRVVLARPGQVVPQGVEVVRPEGARGVALVRILVEHRDVFPAIDKARRASFCRTLQSDRLRY
jgi:uncharacterized membrane protein